MATEQNLIRIFEYALNQEETGKGFFQNSLQRMGIGAAVSAFKRLIEEEEKHIVFISKILDSLRKGEAFEPSGLEGMVLKPTNYFDERAKSEFLQQCVEGSMVPDVTVFNTAWLIEKDISEFYAKMAMQASGKAKSAFQMLADWEKSHEKFFREFRDKIAEVYATMPWGG
jgi:rubrerythrin